MKRWRNDTGRVLRGECIAGRPVIYWAPGDVKSVPDDCESDAIRIGLTPVDAIGQVVPDKKAKPAKNVEPAEPVNGVHNSDGPRKQDFKGGRSTNTRRRRGRGG